MKSQLHRAGHVSRMENYRLPKFAVYGELCSGHCDRGTPKKRYPLKKFLGDYDHQRSSMAADRDAWRGTAYSAVPSFEDSRTVNSKDKHHGGKTWEAQQPYPTSPLNAAATVEPT